MRARQSATWAFGAQASAGLCPSSSSASKLAPLAMSSCTTGTSPFLAAKCKGLWKTNLTTFTDWAHFKWNLRWTVNAVSVSYKTGPNCKQRLRQKNKQTKNVKKIIKLVNFSCNLCGNEIARKRAEKSNAFDTDKKQQQQNTNLRLKRIVSEAKEGISHFFHNKESTCCMALKHRKRLLISCQEMTGYMLSATRVLSFDESMWCGLENICYWNPWCFLADNITQRIINLTLEVRTLQLANFSAIWYTGKCRIKRQNGITV